MLSAAAAQSVPTFTYHSDFTMNLHHTLYRQTGIVETVDDAGSSVLDPMRHRLYEETLELSDHDRAAWYEALAFYQAHYGGRSLIFDEGMVRLDNDLPYGIVPHVLAPVLRDAAPIYRRTMWLRHDASNRRRIAALERYDATYATQLFSRLRTLLETAWLDVPYRIDVVANTERDGAYSNADAAGRFWHIFLSSYDHEHDGLSGFEILAHEAAHSLVDPQYGTLARAIARSAHRFGRPIPDDLWHVVIMYLPGAVLKRLVANRGGNPYEPAFVANGLFANIYPRYYAAMERHLGPYVAGLGTLEEAIETTVRDIVS